MNPDHEHVNTIYKFVNYRWIKETDGWKVKVKYTLFVVISLSTLNTF